MRDWIPEKVKESHVRRAAEIWRKEGGFRNFRDSTRYDVIIDGKPYPPKAISSIAHELATGKVLYADEFGGSKEGTWHRRLKALDFRIQPKGLVTANRSIRASSRKRVLTGAEAEEGYRQDRQASFIKRNRRIIDAAKERDGFRCQACQFFIEVDGKPIVDCHHKVPLSHKSGARVTKMSDLICLCPTCHRIAHTRAHPLSVKEIRQCRGL